MKLEDDLHVCRHYPVLICNPKCCCEYCCVGCHINFLLTRILEFISTDVLQNHLELFFCPGRFHQAKMSRHRKAYDDDDLIDYDDYDYEEDDYAYRSSSASAGAGAGPKIQPKSKSNSKGKSTKDKGASGASNKQAKPATPQASHVDATSAAVGHMNLDSSQRADKPITTSTPIESTLTEEFSDDDTNTVAEATSSCSESLENGKPSVRVVVAGHVDAGKSTLIGNMLTIQGQISQRIIRKYEKQSQEIGKGSFALAWVMDESTAEREHGVTIDTTERYSSPIHNYIAEIIYSSLCVNPGIFKPSIGMLR